MISLASSMSLLRPVIAPPEGGTGGRATPVSADTGAAAGGKEDGISFTVVDNSLSSTRDSFAKCSPWVPGSSEGKGETKI